MNKTLILIIICLSVPAISIAQDSLTKKEIRIQQSDFLQPNPWTVEIPLWIPGFAGEFAYGDVEIEGEDGASIENPIEPEPPGEGIGGIISRLFTTNWYLKFFYLTRVSYEQNKIKVDFDGIVGAMGNSVVFNYNNKELVSASFLSVNLRFYGAYEFVEVWSSNNNFRYEAFAYAGIRTHFQKLRAELDEGTRSLEISPVFTGPLIGLENQFTWKRWLVIVQGDYGSIYSKSKKSLQLSAYAYFRTGRITSLKFGWNHLYINQKKEYFKQDYTVKVSLSGPVVAFAFQF